MEYKNKVVYTAINDKKLGYGIITEKNFVPSNDHRFWQLGNSASIFMQKFQIQKLTVYVPDIAVDKNFKEIIPTLEDIE